MGKQHEMIAMDVQGFMFILACHRVCSHVRVPGSAHDRGCVVNGSSSSLQASPLYYQRMCWTPCPDHTPIERGSGHFCHISWDRLLSSLRNQTTTPHSQKLAHDGYCKISFLILHSLTSFSLYWIRNFLSNFTYSCSHKKCGKWPNPAHWGCGHGLGTRLPRLGHSTPAILHYSSIKSFSKYSYYKTKGMLGCDYKEFDL